MTVYVNEEALELLPGMTVRHALVAAGLLPRVDDLRRPQDEWGNEIGLDGALCEGMQIYLPPLSPLDSCG